MSKHLIPIFTGTINPQGHFVPDAKAKMAQYLHTLIGKTVQCVVKRPDRSIRSLAQNGYYHAVIVEKISEATGYTHDEAHEFLKARFLKHYVVFKEQMVQITRSTTSLKTDEFEDYCEQCRQFAAIEMNLNIPMPGEVEYDIPEIAA